MHGTNFTSLLYLCSSGFSLVHSADHTRLGLWHDHDTIMLPSGYDQFAMSTESRYNFLTFMTWAWRSHKLMIIQSGYTQDTIMTWSWYSHMSSIISLQMWSYYKFGCVTIISSGSDYDKFTEENDVCESQPIPIFLYLYTLLRV